ncbi:hypothetical protein DQ239_18550 [Blastococcus sp. TF02-09]|uniref:TasA family protein n=1 Tax=Blastococcus sp. TF02-09 TaxID=2250576 RepID=UPI000DE91FD2|nr:TasA family protein [Blastococcus sp. TF02-9]RBY74794.1 hypothetical protein DQ239_18550 [Blastococcus sp. TF02-9]
MSTTTSTTGRRSAGRVVGSIVVVGAAAAVAGMGTFGSFTDSTSAVDAAVDTGVMNIDVTYGGTTVPVPVSTVNLLPGDKVAAPLDLRNAGDVDLSSLTLDSYAVASSLLDTDRVNGLQLRLESCDSAWVRSGADYSCAGGAVPLYAGPVVAKKELTGLRSQTAGSTDRLLATVSFPTTGGDLMQNQRSSLEFVFTAAQRAGGAR